MSELVFEIGCEELPAQAVDVAQAFMVDFVSEAFTQQAISFSGLSAYATPRRLVLLVDELSEYQNDIAEEVLGPNVNIAFDGDQLSKAGLGFIASKGLDATKIYRKTTAKGELIAARLVKKGLATRDLLPKIMLELMGKIPFKKRMRWDKSGESFARPVRWLVLFFNQQFLDLSYADVISASVSYGHRFLSPQAFSFSSKKDYQEKLLKAQVILDSKKREAMLNEQAQAQVSALGGKMIEDQALLSMVKNLVEYPFVVLGSFEPSYLSIPQEILISEMANHQKCFAVQNKQGELMPYFVTVAGTKPDDPAVFAAGNARVIRARFEDGAFYFAEDNKKTLIEHAAGLNQLVFERELGTVGEKTERIKYLAGELANIFGFNSDEVTTIKLAAPLLKADLVSGVVGQFPELQGIMGAIYARKDQLAEPICEAIRCHYYPRYAEDMLPPTKSSAVLAIADKLDTLVGILAIAKGPKGNKDPFALRRLAIGIVRILVRFEFDVDHLPLINLALGAYGERFKAKAAVLSQEVADFMIQRARTILADDFGANLADGVLAISAARVSDIFARAQALHALGAHQPAEFASLVQTFKRASNIVKKAQEQGENIQYEPQILSLPAEQNLMVALALLIKEKNASYPELLDRVVAIKPALDRFFADAMIMSEDLRLRRSRLGLLAEIKQIADQLADFRHL